MRFLAEFLPPRAVVVSIAAWFGILKVRLATVAGVALVVLAGAGGASATNTGRITVCPSGCDYATIQDAVNAAPRRAIIIVAAGTYAGFSIPGTNSALTNLTLLGAGAENTTISGTETPDGSPVVANLGVSVRIRGVTISGDRVDGGSGILNNGTLTLTNSTVRANQTSGISNAGTLTLKGSTVSGNSAGLGGGGGIINAGTVTLNDSTVSGNDGGGAGGGIINVGRLAVKDSDVTNNHAGLGGGIYNGGSLAVKKSDVSNNTAGEGGGIYNDNGGMLALKKSMVSNNGANEGGGIYDVDNGEVILATSAITGNTPDNCYPPGSVAGCSG